MNNREKELVDVNAALELLITKEANVRIGEMLFYKIESNIMASRPGEKISVRSYGSFLEDFIDHSFVAEYKPQYENLKPGKLEYVPPKNTGHRSKITMTLESKNLREELRRLFE